MGGETTGESNTGARVMTQRLDSFEKIINLMENAATEGEAEAAAAAFRRLLIRENITEDEVRSRLSETQKAEYAYNFVSSTKAGQWYQREFTMMMSVIAKANLCFFASIGVDSRSGIITGRQKNIDRVLEIFEAFKKSANARCNESRRGLPKAVRKDYSQGFYFGAAIGLGAKYDREAAADSAKETQLVVMESENSEAYLAEIFGKPSENKRELPTNLTGVTRGYAFGSTYGPGELNG